MQLVVGQVWGSPPHAGAGTPYTERRIMAVDSVFVYYTRTREGRTTRHDATIDEFVDMMHDHGAHLVHDSMRVPHGL